ncbi:hypothetical protein F4779DRAFT_568589 [Xylariaceae sp. FL0662B]|nr:hypothetical protein F4779DRAFT_568589 [Xylariaceae sp. FL0662B]
MRPLVYGLAALCTAFAAGVRAASSTTQSSSAFNISVQYYEDGHYVRLRTWYGDGNMYVGDAVPAGIESAFNFTVPNLRADLLYIQPVAPVSPQTTPPTPTLPDPTFLVLNNSPDATDALFFAHSAAGLGPDAVLFWARYSTLLLPVVADATPRFFLDAAAGAGAEGGTYVVKWRGGTAREKKSKELRRRGRPGRSKIDGVGGVVGGRGLPLEGRSVLLVAEA